MRNITRQQANWYIISNSIVHLKKHANDKTLGQNLQPCRKTRQSCSMAVVAQAQWYVNADKAPKLHPQTRGWSAQASEPHFLITHYQPPVEVPKQSKQTSSHNPNTAILASSHNRRQAMTLTQLSLLAPHMNTTHQHKNKEHVFGPNVACSDIAEHAAKNSPAVSTGL